jgi:hypothetical protein
MQIKPANISFDNDQFMAYNITEKVIQEGGVRWQIK